MALFTQEYLPTSVLCFLAYVFLCVWAWGGDFYDSFFWRLLSDTVLWYRQTVVLKYASSISVRKELNLSFGPFDRHPEEKLGSPNAKTFRHWLQEWVHLLPLKLRRCLIASSSVYLFHVYQYWYICATDTSAYVRAHVHSYIRTCVCWRRTLCHFPWKLAVTNKLSVIPAFLIAILRF
jgi:hypothetical protein